MADFNQSQVETGRVTFTAGYAAEVDDKLQVTFKSKFNYVPNVSIIIENSNKVAIADSFGYDEYYIVPSGNMNVETDELEVSSDMTKGRMAKAFMKHMKSKTVNRILLNKFVEKIA